MREAKPPGPGINGLARRIAPRPVLEVAQAVKRRARSLREPRLGAYAPISTLQLPQTEVGRACIPAIDFHAHLGRWQTRDGSWMVPDVRAFVEVIDRCNIAGVVNLDGRWGEELDTNLTRYDRSYPGRFYTFCHLDWRVLDDANGAERLVASLRRSAAAGARGLKVWKDLGMKVRVRGRLLAVDDPILAPVWETAGELGLPVLIHVADPMAFFQPVDCHNERFEELLRVPESAQPGGMSAYQRLMDSFEAMVANHPNTRVVAAHACCAENLSYVSDLLSRYPNLSIDIGWRQGELGRQPRTARRLILEHADRVLFGTDALPPRTSIYEIYFRLLETEDENFAYSDDPVPPCGRWSIYGLDLPPAVLEQVYHLNARRLLNLTDEEMPPAPDSGQRRGEARRPARRLNRSRLF